MHIGDSAAKKGLFRKAQLSQLVRDWVVAQLDEFSAQTELNTTSVDDAKGLVRSSFSRCNRNLLLPLDRCRAAQFTAQCKYVLPLIAEACDEFIISLQYFDIGIPFWITPDKPARVLGEILVYRQ